MKNPTDWSLWIAASLLVAAVSHAQTTITSVPYTINTSGTYVFGSDLQFPLGAGNAINVDASNVAIDFAGHSLSTPSRQTTSPTSYGIYVNNRDAITVTNGEINGFVFGIFFTYTSGAVINGSIHLEVGISSTGSNSTVGNYYYNNLIVNASNGILMPAGGNDKYRFNVTTNCSNPYFGGTALTSENN